MPSQAEIDRRKALRRAAEQQARAAEEARMPLSKEALGRLFDYLDLELAAGCDHTLRFTRQYLLAEQLSSDLVVPWLGEYGGFCDCEVLNNVEDRWGK